MNQNRFTRRRFVAAVIALAGAAGTMLEPRLLAVSRAWAESPGQMDEAVRLAMVRMARLLYPHDALSDEVYADVLDRALSETATSAVFAGQLDEVTATLDARSGESWHALDAAAQIEIMRSIETESYFVAIQDSVRTGIYNGSAYWKHVGYPGPSKDFGGYLHRGAGEIDWLPEDL